MSLYTTFSLTPREPFGYLWDSTNSHYNYHADLKFYGAHIASAGSNSLEGSYNNNLIFLFCNLVDYPFPDPFPSNYYDHAIACLRFKTDKPTDKQYLMLFHVTCYSKIGVYLNGNLVQENDCNGDETIAVLVDCPGPNIYESMYIVPQYSADIKGVDCYII